MPYVNIRLAGPGPTEEQKSRLIRGVTNLIVEVLQKPAELTMVIIDELDPTGVGIGGRTVTEIRKDKR